MEYICCASQFLNLLPRKTHFVSEFQVYTGMESGELNRRRISPHEIAGSIYFMLMLYDMYDGVLFDVYDGVLYDVYDSILYDLYDSVLYDVYDGVLYDVYDSVLYDVYDGVSHYVYGDVL